MNLTRIPHRLELVFWATLIPLMEESRYLRFLLRGAFTLIDMIRNLDFYARVMILSASGLVFGFCLGYLATAMGLL